MLRFPPSPTIQYVLINCSNKQQQQQQQQQRADPAQGVIWIRQLQQTTVIYKNKSDNDADNPELPEDDQVPAADQRQVRGQPALRQQAAAALRQAVAQEPPPPGQAAHRPSEGKMQRCKDVESRAMKQSLGIILKLCHGPACENRKFTFIIYLSLSLTLKSGEGVDIPDILTH